MKTTSWSFIVMSSHSPALEKFTISFKGALILVAALVLAFVMTVFLLLMFPASKVNEPDRARLAAENQALRMDNKDVVLKLGNLNTQMLRVEQNSHRVATLMQAD
jgi:hypothetical protein